jgi:hypothetical protein
MKLLSITLLIIALMTPSFANEKFKNYAQTESGTEAYSDSFVPSTSIYVHPISLLISAGLKELPTIFFLTLETEITPGLNFVAQPGFAFGTPEIEDVKFTSYTDIIVALGLRKYLSSESTSWFIQGLVGYESIDLAVTDGYNKASISGGIVVFKANFGQALRGEPGFNMYWDVGYLRGFGEFTVEYDEGEADFDPPTFEGIDINLGIGYGF